MKNLEIPIQLKKLQPFWGEWVIESHIGSGAYGEVYRIVRKRGPREFKALKWIQIPLRSEGSETMADNMQEEKKRRYQEQKERLLKEVTAMEQVKENRNVVRIEEYMVHERPKEGGYDILIRMEYLTPLLEKYPIGPLEQGIVVRLGMDICAALAVCESKNMIHRDLKPGNVFIDPQGNFKLGDFGISRVLEDGQAGTTIIGTRAYMAPDMFDRFRKYDQTVDIYALSVMLYRYVNDGRLPFFHETDGSQTLEREEKAIQRRIQEEAIPPARQASAELNRILLKAMSPNPADRYQFAGEMWQDLASLPVTPAERINNPPSVPMQNPQTKIRPWHIAAGITLTVGIAFAGYQLWIRNSERSDSSPSSMNGEKHQKQQEETVTLGPYMGRTSEPTSTLNPTQEPSTLMPESTASLKPTLEPATPTPEPTSTLNPTQESSTPMPEPTASLKPTLEPATPTPELTSTPEPMPTLKPTQNLSTPTSEPIPTLKLTQEPATPVPTSIREPTPEVTAESMAVISDLSSEELITGQNDETAVQTGIPDHVVSEGEWGTCQWSIDDEGILTVKEGVGESFSQSPWLEYLNNIEAVVFEDNVVFPQKCSYMFTDGEDQSSNLILNNVIFGKIDTTNVIDMSHMFSGCASLIGIDLRGMDTSAVENMSYMFHDCIRLLSVDVSGFDTSSVNNMKGMFAGCSSLKSVVLQGFNTSLVKDMSQMFKDCSSLTIIDLSNFDTASVENIDGLAGMFEGCSEMTVKVIPGTSVEKQAKLSGVSVMPLTELIYDPVIQIVTLKTEGNSTTYKCDVEGFQLFSIYIECDKYGTIVSVNIPHHNEPKGRIVIENKDVLDQLVGQAVAEAQIDMVSGATVTCEAINKALQRVGTNYQSLTGDGSETIVVIREGVTVNIREKPGLDERRIGQGKAGTEYRLLEIVKVNNVTWYKIDLGNGEVGYVHSNMTELKE